MSSSTPASTGVAFNRTATECRACAKHFGIFTSVENCRVCGDRFCKKCSRFYIALPTDEFPGYRGEPVATCFECYKKHCNFDGSRTYTVFDGPSEAAPTVVLIGGALGSRGIFVWFVPELQRHFRVVSMDLPGLGSRMPEELTLDSAVAAVKLIVEETQRPFPAAGKTGVLLLGASMGGYVAHEVAARYPDICDGVITQSSMNICNKGTASLLFKMPGLVYKMTPYSLSCKFVSMTYGGNDALSQRVNEAVLRGGMDYDRWSECSGIMCAVDIVDCARKITKPILYVIGEHKDPQYSVDEILAAAGPKVTFQKISGTTHLLTVEETGIQKFIECINQWLTATVYPA